MGLVNLFKLEKLKILVFSDRERKLQSDMFQVMFNPESYSQSYENVFQRVQGINTSGREARYSMSLPSELSLKLILDGTGVSTYGIENLLGGKKDVATEVKRFLKLTSYMDGTIHEPKFLQIFWGNLKFSCRLKKVTINYSLFDQSGLPLRAELDAVFVSDLTNEERAKEENKTSPDLTHYRVVQAHDTLPAMCEQIYGSPHYFIQVARVNGLNDFRNLQPGQELFFPPING